LQTEVPGLQVARYARCCERNRGANRDRSRESLEGRIVWGPFFSTKKTKKVFLKNEQRSNQVEQHVEFDTASAEIHCNLHAVRANCPKSAFEGLPRGDRLIRLQVKTR